jgi:hypothetical protein
MQKYYYVRFKRDGPLRCAIYTFFLAHCPLSMRSILAASQTLVVRTLTLKGTAAQVCTDEPYPED